MTSTAREPGSCGSDAGLGRESNGVNSWSGSAPEPWSEHVKESLREGPAVTTTGKKPTHLHLQCCPPGARPSHSLSHMVCHSLLASPLGTHFPVLLRKLMALQKPVDGALTSAWQGLGTALLMSIRKCSALFSSS